MTCDPTPLRTVAAAARATSTKRETIKIWVRRGKLTKHPNPFDSTRYLVSLEEIEKLRQ